MKKILLPVSFIFLMGLFPEQLFARELTRAEINRLSFYDTSSIAKVILIENVSERQRMLIEIRLLLSLHKYYTAKIDSYNLGDGEYFVVYRYNRGILITIGSSAFEIKFYNSRENISGISEIVENTYDKLVESIEMFEFINGVNTSLVPPPGPIYEIDPSDIIPEVVEVVEYILVPAPERPSERQFDERTQLEYEVVGGRSVTITSYTGNATTVNIPVQIDGLSVTFIRDYAFVDCESLTNITIPSSVTSIGDLAFSGYAAAQGCNNLTSFTVDNRNPSYASIDGVLFDKNIRTLIRYPEGKTARIYTIPSSVTAIKDSAFLDCRSLTSVTIPSSVTAIGDRAFYGCSLASVTIPSSVTVIGYGAFAYCNSLASITIPSSVTSIGLGAFQGCSSLTSVTIPSSVTVVGDFVFSDCNSLTSITVDNRNPSYASIDGVLFDKKIQTLIRYPQGKKGTYVIPSSVTSIEYVAFSGCESLTSVTISSSVTFIGEYAFSGCESLTSVTIPSSVTSIREGAFYGCSSLANVTIPSSVTSIREGAFSGCESLTNVSIPSSVTSIGENAFWGCRSLTSVILSRRTRVGEDAFPETARIIYRD